MKGNAKRIEPQPHAENSRTLKNGVPRVGDHRVRTHISSSAFALSTRSHSSPRMERGGRLQLREEMQALVGPSLNRLIRKCEPRATIGAEHNVRLTANELVMQRVEPHAASKDVTQRRFGRAFKIACESVAVKRGLKEEDLIGILLKIGNDQSRVAVALWMPRSLAVLEQR